MGWEEEERSELVGIPGEAIFRNSSFQKDLSKSESALVQSWCHLVANCYKCSISRCEDLWGQKQSGKEWRIWKPDGKWGNFMSFFFQNLDPWVQGRTGLTLLHRPSAHLRRSGLLRRLAVFARSLVSSCCCPMVTFSSWLLAGFITSALVYDFFLENPTSF